MFPKVEIKRFGGSYAFIFTESGTLQIYRIRSDHERAFNTDLGRFQVKKEHRYPLGKGDVYFYDQKACNPIDVMALVDIRKFLTDRQLDVMPSQLTAVLSGAKAFPEYLPMKQQQEEYLDERNQKRTSTYSVVDNERIHSIIEDTIKDDKVDIVEPAKGRAKLEQKTVQFMGNYYNEDVQVHLAAIGKMLASMKYRAKGSMKAFGIFSMEMNRKDHIALVIINNRLLDAVPAKLELDIESGKYSLVTKKYGKFRVSDTKTRYKYGKSNIYVVSVRTIPPKIKEKEPRKPLFAAQKKQQKKPNLEEMQVQLARLMAEKNKSEGETS